MQSSQTIDRKQRIFGYDALKALAAFFVVLYHVGMVDKGYREGVYYYPTLVQLLWLFCGCGVPLFFMVNGALTVSRHYDFKKTLNKSSRLLLIGVFWGVLVMCEHAAFDGTDCFTIREIPYYWFLFSLALMYVASFVLGQINSWCKWAVVVILLIFPFTTNLFWVFVQLFRPEMHLPKWFHTGVFTLYGLVYLYAGDYLAHHRVDKRMVWVGAILGLALLALETIAVVNRTHAPFEGGNYCFPSWGALFLSCSLFILIKGWNPVASKLKGIITFLGNNALGIYILHLMVMFLLAHLFPQVANCTVHPVLAIVIALAYMFVSAFISEMIRRSPLSFLLKL